MPLNHFNNTMSWEILVSSVDGRLTIAWKNKTCLTTGKLPTRKTKWKSNNNHSNPYPPIIIAKLFILLHSICIREERVFNICSWKNLPQLRSRDTLAECLEYRKLTLHKTELESFIRVETPKYMTKIPLMIWEFPTLRPTYSLGRT
jgi:hypothetical protein